MKISLYIAEYLKSHRRLVVPQLGAFIVKSPGGEILFSEMLKRDDGVLRALLTANGAGEIEASGIIDRFIFELRHTIESGSVYKAEGLGVFALGENHTILFRHIAEFGSEGVEEESASDEEATQREPQAQPVEPTEPVAPLEAESAVEAQTAVVEQTVEQTESRVDSSVEASVEPKSEPVQSRAEQNRERIKSLLGSHPSEGRSSSKPRRDDPSLRGLRYGKPMKTTDAFTYVNSAPSRRPDTFVVLAIVAVLIALGAILYGYLSDRKKSSLEQDGVELSIQRGQHFDSAEGYLFDYEA